MAMEWGESGRKLATDSDCPHSREREMNERKNILICCSGSVATIKIPEIIVKISSWANILIVCSSSAEYFLSQAKEYSPERWKEFQSLYDLKECLLLDSHER
jgi:hypothetical protein